MKAYRKSKFGKTECKRFDDWLIAIKKKFVDALPVEQQTLLRWEFGTGNTSTLGNLPKTWEEYAEQNNLAPQELLVILSVSTPYFRKSGNPDLEWDLHFPMKICFPHLLLSRPSNRDPTENALDAQAKALFSLNTSIAVMKPPASKKRKLEEVVSGAEDCAATGEEVLAQVPLGPLCPCLDRRRSQCQDSLVASASDSQERNTEERSCFLSQCLHARM